ncbi:MAG: cell division protein FtsA [Candidatus Parcubacteria bacterium]|nr:MAG: cell division protein FtsA [Candidatus Parcubacteria bacterium]
MRSKIFSLDLGSKTLKICVGEEDEQGKITLLTKLAKNIESFNDGEIIDVDAFREEVINTLKDVAYQIGEEPKNLILSFSSSSFQSQKAKGRVSISEKYITDEDIRKCHLLAKASLTSTSYEFLFEEPIAYFLDNINIKVRDPLGMEARSLEVDFFVVQGLKSTISRLRDFFQKNGFKISLILPNPLPASFILIPKKEKEQGVILVDFGYKIFNVSIFQEGKLIYYRNLRFGLGDILEDLALDFSLSFEEIFSLFNEIKNYDDTKKKTKIKIGRQKITHYNFLKLIEKKFSLYWKKNALNDLFKKIKEDYRLPAGVYLIGAASYLPEINYLFRKYSTYPTKIETDKDKNLNLDERIFLNAVGSIFYYQRLFQPKTFFDNLKDLFFNLFR